VSDDGPDWLLFVAVAALALVVVLIFLGWIELPV
jgi:hypothetical protein